ncbi:MAG: hypothetical protein ACOY3Z_03760, partial [Thermodesulfobacteriota bacterium]
EIDAASNEQARGIEENTKAIQQFDQVIQANSAAAEEMAATSEQLTAQSAMLQDTIGFFRIGNTGMTYGREQTHLSRQALPGAKSVMQKKGWKNPPPQPDGKGVQLALTEKGESEFERY